MELEQTAVDGVERCSEHDLCLAAGNKPVSWRVAAASKIGAVGLHGPASRATVQLPGCEAAYKAAHNPGTICCTRACSEACGSFLAAGIAHFMLTFLPHLIPLLNPALLLAFATRRPGGQAQGRGRLLLNAEPRLMGCPVVASDLSGAVGCCPPRFRR